MFKISSLTLTLQRCSNFYKAQMNTYYGIFVFKSLVKSSLVFVSS
ncbi:uncharacterized protein BN506_03909 [Bacteroides cellulosilyticus CAG:158]|nr:uncharacterized protein BN506_03909 [Bacteroides cellulosilyticus CAG:158]